MTSFTKNIFTFLHRYWLIVSAFALVGMAGCIGAAYALRPMAHTLVFKPDAQSFTFASPCSRFTLRSGEQATITVHTYTKGLHRTPQLVQTPQGIVLQSRPLQGIRGCVAEISLPQGRVVRIPVDSSFAASGVRPLPVEGNFRPISGL